MKVLVNYSAEEKGWLPVLNALLKERGHTAVANAGSLEMKHIIALNKNQQAGGNDAEPIGAIVCCNESSLKNLVQAATSASVSLDSFRGSVLHFPIPVIVVNSLPHIRSVRHGKWLLGKDLDKISTLGQPLSIPTFTVCDTRETIDRAVARAKEAIFISRDIETDKIELDPDKVQMGAAEVICFMTCSAFTFVFPTDKPGVFKTENYVFPFVDFRVDHFKNDEDYAYAIEGMRAICKNSITKVMFNAPYDASYDIMYHSEDHNLTIDVMGMAHSQYSELPKTLDFVTSLHDPHYMQWKVEAALAKKNNDIRAYWMYCVKDSFNTAKNFLFMLQQYPEYAFTNYKQMFKFIYPALYAAFEGVKIDKQEKLRLAQEAKARIEVQRNELRIMAANPNFNPGSWQQVQELLYDIIGARALKGKGTDEKTLTRVAEQHPILAALCTRIIKYREDVKAYGTYFTFVGKNGRLLYTITVFGPESARFASKASNFWCGTQIQNIPEYAKGMLIADEGYVLVEFDNSKSEARIVAYFAACIALIKALEDPEKDFYMLLATMFFGIPYEKVTKELRNKVMKRVIHGKNYVMQADTFIDVTGAKNLIDGALMLKYKLTTLKDFAEYLLNLYDYKFPEVSEHYDEIKAEILTTGKLTSVLGYTRHFFGDIMKDAAMLRGAIAHEPQNLSVAILNIGLWKCYRQLVLFSKGAIRFKAQIHDSLWFQIKNDDKLEERCALIQKLMDNPVMIKGRKLSIPVEEKSGFRWHEKEE